MPVKKTAVIAIAVLVVLALFYFFRSFLFVAFVNGKPISRWALDRELERVGGQQILNTKIAEMLVFQKAKKQKVTISEAELNSEVKKLEDNFKAQGQTLDDILALQGQSRKEFLRQIQLQLLVEKMLGKDKRSKRQKVKVPMVIKKVAKEFKLTVKELKGSRRTEDIAFARQVAMFILREDFGFKLDQVAKYLERNDHTTVIHAVDKIKSKLMIDEGFKVQIDQLRESIMNEAD